MKKKISAILFAMLVSLTVSPALLADGTTVLPGWRVSERLTTSIMIICDEIRSSFPEAYYSVDAQQNRPQLVGKDFGVDLTSQAQANVRTARSLVAAARANAADGAAIGRMMAGAGIRSYSDANAVRANAWNAAAAETRVRGARANVEDRGSPVDYSAAKTHTGAHAPR